MKEEWLMPGAIVPVDPDTTKVLIDEIKRLINITGDLLIKKSIAEEKREWVGLTYEEHDNIKDNYHNMTWTLEMFARAVEQALKEKNNG